MCPEKRYKVSRDSEAIKQTITTKTLLGEGYDASGDGDQKGIRHF